MKLSKPTLKKLSKYITEYSLKMKLFDWTVKMNDTYKVSDTEYAELTDIDIFEKSAILSLTTLQEKTKFSLRRIVVHELTHILLANLKEKYMGLVQLKEKQIQDTLTTKHKQYIKLINSNSELIDKWLTFEEEKICTTMEYILVPEEC